MEQNEINELFKEQLDSRDTIINNLIDTNNRLVDMYVCVNKSNKRTVWFVLVSTLVAMAFILSSFFVSYFKTDYSKEIKEKNSSYNYNENINRNVNE